MEETGNTFTKNKFIDFHRFSNQFLPRRMQKPFKGTIIYFISMFVFFFSFSCEKTLDKFTEFDMDYTTTITVPAQTTVDAPVDLYSPDVETNSEQEFENNNTRKDKIEEIYLKSMQLTVEQPADEDFSFLKSITLYISADGLDERKLAWKDSIPDDAQKIDLNTSDYDFKDYLKKDTYEIRVKTVTDETISQDYEIKIDAVFHVNAEVLGV